MLKVPNEWTFSTPVGMHNAISRNFLNISTGGWSHLKKKRKSNRIIILSFPPGPKKKSNRKNQKSSLQTQQPLERSQFGLRMVEDSLSGQTASSKNLGPRPMAFAIRHRQRSIARRPRPSAEFLPANFEKEASQRQEVNYTWGCNICCCLLLLFLLACDRCHTVFSRW